MKAIVVGASSGIGAAIARQLAQEGASVALIARRQTELDKIIAELTLDKKGRALAYTHDVTNYDATPALFDRIVADLGGLDLLVYAAGVMPNIEESEYDFAKDRAMIEVNVIGAMAWCNPAAAHFEAHRKGSIVGISSIAGERGRRGNPAYCTSKAALTTYLEGLRNRLSRYGVNVVTIKPGFVATAMTQGKPGLFWLVQPEDIANTTLALARAGNGAARFVPRRWWLVAFIVRMLPSFIFRRLNF